MFSLIRVTPKPSSPSLIVIIFVRAVSDVLAGTQSCSTQQRNPMNSVVQMRRSDTALEDSNSERRECEYLSYGHPSCRSTLYNEDHML
ncbi:hypothetical protein F5050DRAFT_1769707 [Lentinula boryana]|uniref:Secreted protein n=1 Tax=Lentinula boryana TaxID=40481 RepID=A0ABQ8Q9I0_9AGAR|nr:hypothetical protein F5050DRAFT_1769707 [Lentinula boryana]